jgi:hypothetical protein
MELKNKFLLGIFILLLSCVSADKPISMFTLRDIGQLIIFFFVFCFIVYIFRDIRFKENNFIIKILDYIYDNFQIIFLLIILLILISFM